MGSKFTLKVKTEDEENVWVAVIKYKIDKKLPNLNAAVLDLLRKALRSETIQKKPGNYY